MPRSPRIQTPDQIYHVINRGNNRHDVFRSDNDFAEYLYLLERYKHKFSIKLYHYVLMPNHIHLLLEPTIENTLARFMQGITLAHTLRVNKKYGLVGHLWQGRYKNILIKRANRLLACGRYIELNPVRAKIVSHPSDYRWSSYGYLAEGKLSKIIDHDPLYTGLEKTDDKIRRRYKQFIEEGMRRES